MSVHFKFKSSKDYDTILFDGSYISLGELKRSIIAKKKLGKSTDFDLIITNAQTGEDFKDDTFLVQKNTSVIVRRVPIAAGGRGAAPVEVPEVPTPVAPVMPVPVAAKKEAEQDEFANPIFGTSTSIGDGTGDSENDKIQAIVNQAGGWNTVPTRLGKYPANIVSKAGPMMEIKPPPPTYICHRCNQPGHYIQQCPTNGDPMFDFHKIKKPAGIPKCFLQPVSGGTSKASLMMPGGGYAVMVPNEAEFEKAIGSKGHIPADAIAIPQDEVPLELQCPVCRGILIDAVLIPCCGNSFCDKCIRSALVSTNNTCPQCQRAGMMPDQVVPNQKVRQAVEGFMKKFLEAALATPSVPSPVPSAVETKPEETSAVVDVPSQPVPKIEPVPVVKPDSPKASSPPPSVEPMKVDVDTKKTVSDVVVNSEDKYKPVPVKRSRSRSSSRSRSRSPADRGKKYKPVDEYLDPYGYPTVNPVDHLKAKVERLCFKCGKPGHLARDCYADPMMDYGGYKPAFMMPFDPMFMAPMMMGPMGPMGMGPMTDSYGRPFSKQQFLEHQSRLRRAYRPDRSRSRSRSRSREREMDWERRQRDREYGDRRRSRSRSPAGERRPPRGQHDDHLPHDRDYRDYIRDYRDYRDRDNRERDRERDNRERDREREREKDRERARDEERRRHREPSSKKDVHSNTEETSDESSSKKRLHASGDSETAQPKRSRTDGSPGKDKEENEEEERDKENTKEKENAKDKEYDKIRSSRDKEKESSKDKEYEKMQSSRDKEKESSKDKEYEKMRSSRDKEKESGRDKEKESGRDKEKEGSRDKEKESSRDKERDSSRDKERDSSRDKERLDSSRDKERDSSSRDKEKETRSSRSEKDHERREREKEHRSHDRDKKDRDREKEKEKHKEKESRSKDKDKEKGEKDEKRPKDHSSHREKDKERDRDKERGKDRESRDKERGKDRESRDKDKERSKEREHRDKDKEGRSKDKEREKHKQSKDKEGKEASSSGQSKEKHRRHNSGSSSDARKTDSDKLSSSSNGKRSKDKDHSSSSEEHRKKKSSSIERQEV